MTHILKQILVAALILTITVGAAAGLIRASKGASLLAEHEEQEARDRETPPSRAIRKQARGSSAPKWKPADPSSVEQPQKAPAGEEEAGGRDPAESPLRDSRDQQRGGPASGDEKAIFAALESDLKKQIASSGLQTRLCLYDYAADEWILLEAHCPLYPASMIKMLLLLTALEQAEKGNILLDEPFELGESDKYAGGTRVAGTGILQFAGAGGLYSLEDLLTLMVSRSDNVATNIVFDRIGTEKCAALARRLGLDSSAFNRKMYDLESELPSNVSTAYELARMLTALQNREIAGDALSRKGIGMMAAAVDKGRIGRFAGARAVVANKVGTVSGVVGDMALLFFPERPPLALTVVVENPPDREEAAAFIGRLAWMIVEALRG